MYPCKQYIVSYGHTQEVKIKRRTGIRNTEPECGTGMQNRNTEPECGIEDKTWSFLYTRNFYKRGIREKMQNWNVFETCPPRRQSDGNEK